MSDKNDALYAFRKYGDTVLRAAYAVTGSYHEAEDITQEVFLKLHAAPQEFENDEHMKAWLLRVTINRCKNFKKSFRFSRTSVIDETLENTLKCEFTERDNEIREQIERLPERKSPVTDFLQEATSDGVPETTTSPPCIPAPGPISTI